MSSRDETEPVAGPSTSSLPPNRSSTIRNASARSKALSRHRHLKVQSKLSRRLEQKRAEDQDPSKRDARLRENVPRTVENTRVWAGDGEGDERTRPVGVQVVPPTEEGADEDVQLDLGSLSSLFASYPPPDPDSPPPLLRTLLTTSPRPSKLTYAFAEELKSLLGGDRAVEFVPRRHGRYELGKVCGWASKRGYGSMVVIAEDQGGRNRSGPTHLTVCRLPYGPSAHFRLTSLTPGPAIPHHGRPTSHFPELVLSNFSTPLGLSIGTLLQSVFPPMPELEGRQVVSLQNQRDFVFVRRWRYAFAQRDKVLLKPGDEQFRTRLQELGPRFTLKLRWLKRGTLASSSNVDVEPGHEGEQSMKDDVEEEEKEKRREGSRKGREREAERRKEEEEERKAAKEAGVELDLASATEAAEETMAKKKQKKRKRKPTSAGIQEAFLRGDDVASSASEADEGDLILAPTEPSTAATTNDDPSPTEPANAKIQTKKPKKAKPATREGGGLADYMKDVKDRLDGKPGAKKKRQLEFEWKPRMGVSRRTFML